MPIYSIFCTLNGQTIATIHGDCADDEAAIAKARWYLRTSAANTARVHRGAPFYPLGDMIAELKPLPPDLEGMNGERAEWAAAALRHFQCTTGTEWQDAVSDLLADLMHLCDREGFDFSKKLDRARMHYEAETTAPERADAKGGAQ